MIITNEPVANPVFVLWIARGFDGLSTPWVIAVFTFSLNSLIPMGMLVLVWYTIGVIALSFCIEGFCFREKQRTMGLLRPMSVLASSSKDSFREEQLRIQQDILQRRKDKNQMDRYFKSVEERRKGVSKAAAETKWRDEKGFTDPLNRWLEAKKNGKVNPLGYEPVPDKTKSKLGLTFVVPLNPIGMPRYDNGERFDLRLPYAETGYEDPEADFMGKIAKKFQNAFRGSEKDTKETQIGSSTEKTPSKTTPSQRSKQGSDSDSGSSQTSQTSKSEKLKKYFKWF